MDLSRVTNAALGSTQTWNVQGDVAMATLKQAEDAALKEAEALIKMVQESGMIGREIDLTA
jgi:hypothetical protein